MKLANLTLEGVLGAPDGHYDLRDLRAGEPAAAVRVSGGNAAGKTSLLRAIAALKEHVGGAGGAPRLSSLRARGKPRGRIAGTWLLSEAEQRWAETKSAEHVTEVILDDGAVQPLPDPGLRQLFTTEPRLEGVGRLELVPEARAFRRHAPDLPPVRERALRAKPDPDKYAALHRWIVGRAAADGARALSEVRERGIVSAWDKPDSLSDLRTALARVLENVRLAAVVPGDEASEVRFEHRDGRALDLFELSHSEQDGVLLTTAILRGELFGSVVLIDEPSPNLAAVRSVHRLRALSAVARESQLIYASSAPELEGALEGQVEVDLGQLNTGRG